MLKLVDGSYYKGNGFSIIPYKHFRFNHIWEVIVWKDEKKDSLRLFAESPFEAAKKAVEIYPSYQDEKKKVREWENFYKSLRQLGFAEALDSGKITEEQGKALLRAEKNKNKKAKAQKKIDS